MANCCETKPAVAAKTEMPGKLQLTKKIMSAWWKKTPRDRKKHQKMAVVQEKIWKKKIPLSNGGGV